MSTDPRKGTKAGSGNTNTKKQADYYDDGGDYEQTDSYYNGSSSDGKYVPSDYTQVKQGNLKKATTTTGGSTAYSQMYEGGDYDDTDPSDTYYTAAGDYTPGTNYSQMQQGIPSKTKQTSTNNSTTEKTSSGKKQ